MSTDVFGRRRLSPIQPMTEFTDAVTDAQKQLNRRDYEPFEAIVYAHPNTVTGELNKNPMVLKERVGEPPTVNGSTIETTPNVPENVVVLVHLDAMRLGPDAVAFETIEEVDDE